MRVLVACEYSGTVRDAFIAAGHDAISCDILPSDVAGPHYQGDVRDLLSQPFDLLIAHPPCTYLCNSGVRWLYGGKGSTRDTARWAAMEAGAVFFRLLWTVPIARVCVENPIMHRYAAGIIGQRQNQVLQPWQFGHGEVKATGLWLRGLPLLTPTNVVVGRTPRVHHASPGPNRWKERSTTYAGIAAAMASQWGSLNQQARKDGTR